MPCTQAFSFPAISDAPVVEPAACDDKCNDVADYVVQAMDYGLIDRISTPLDLETVERKDYEGRLQAQQNAQQRSRRVPAGLSFCSVFGLLCLACIRAVQVLQHSGFGQGLSGHLCRPLWCAVRCES